MTDQKRKKVERLIFHAPKITIAVVLLMFPVTFAMLKIETIDNYMAVIPFISVVAIIFIYSRISKKYGKSLVKYGVKYAIDTFGTDTTYIKNDKSIIDKDDPSIWRDAVEKTEIDGILTCRFGKNCYEINNIKTTYKRYGSRAGNISKNHKNRTVFKGIRIASMARLKRDIAFHIRTSSMIAGYNFDCDEISISGKLFNAIKNSGDNTKILKGDPNTQDSLLGQIGELLDDFSNKHKRECSVFINDGNMQFAIRNFQFFRFQDTIDRVSRGFTTNPEADVNNDMLVITDSLELMNTIIELLQ